MDARHRAATVRLIAGCAVVLSIAGCRSMLQRGDQILTPTEHINLGVAYEKQGNYGAALTQYDLAYRQSQSPTAAFYIGNIHFYRKEYREAEDWWRTTLKLDPKHADAMNNLAYLYALEKRRLDEAESLARQAIELKPENEVTYRDTLMLVESAKEE